VTRCDACERRRVAAVNPRNPRQIQEIALYVPMTRGRESNHAYLAIDGGDTPIEVFARYVGIDWADVPAHQRALEVADGAVIEERAPTSAARNDSLALGLWTDCWAKLLRWSTQLMLQTRPRNNASDAERRPGDLSPTSTDEGYVAGFDGC
jgi:hypothetical protein